MAFKCEYSLQGECQLYSKPCSKEVGCQLMNCSGCIFKDSMYEKHCAECAERGRK